MRLLCNFTRPFKFQIGRYGRWVSFFKFQDSKIPIITLKDNLNLGLYNILKKEVIISSTILTGSIQYRNWLIKVLENLKVEYLATQLDPSTYSFSLKLRPSKAKLIELAYRNKKTSQRTIKDLQRVFYVAK